VAARRVVGVLVATAMVLPFGGMAAAPTGAAGGTKCNKITGTAQFTPSLFVLSRKKKRAATVTSTGTFSRCTGGGVSSGTFTASYKIASGNCTTLLTYNPTPITVKIITTWNSNQTSTATIKIHAIKTEPQKHTVTGVITAGLFKGSHATATFTFAFVTKGACLNTPLKEISIGGGPVAIS
jgi:hypothetical protein